VEKYPASLITSLTSDNAQNQLPKFTYTTSSRISSVNRTGMTE